MSYVIEVQHPNSGAWLASRFPSFNTATEAVIHGIRTYPRHSWRWAIRRA